MSERLDEFMKTHRDEFDFLEPADKVWNNIDANLNKGKKRSFYPVLWKAAAILIVFGYSFWAQMQMEQTSPELREYVSVNKPKEAIAAPESEAKEMPVIAKQMDKVMPEFAETEQYYNRKVNSTVNELKVYLVKYPEVANDMKKDLAELDSVYRALKHDLGDNVAHDEILNAMIQNYRMKLQILEEIKSELMQTGTAKPKNDSHEI